MRLDSKRFGILFLFVLAAMALLPRGARASTSWWDFSPPEVPPLIRLSGFVYPPQDQGKVDGLYTFPIRAGGERMIFKVEESRSLSGSSLSSTLLNHVWPPQLQFIGPEDLLRQFDDAVGGPVTVTGYLYVGSRQLFLQSVEQGGFEQEG
ncbi:MAG: hypothetical protein AB1640_10740 [bacterium]